MVINCLMLDNFDVMEQGRLFHAKFNVASEAA